MSVINKKEGLTMKMSMYTLIITFVVLMFSMVVNLQARDLISKNHFHKDSENIDHRGKTDEYGCHEDSKGNYHCH